MTRCLLLLVVFLSQAATLASAADDLAEAARHAKGEMPADRLKALHILQDLLVKDADTRAAAIELLLPLLRDNAQEVRRTTVDVIFSLAGDKAQEKDPRVPLNALLASEEVAVRGAAMAATQSIDDKLVLELVPPQLADKNSATRRAALESLDQFHAHRQILKWMPGQRAYYASPPVFGEKIAVEAAKLKADENTEVAKLAAEVERALRTRANLEALQLSSAAPAEPAPVEPLEKLPIELAKGNYGKLHCWARHGDLIAVGYYYNSIRRGEDGTKRGYLHFYDAKSGRMIGSVPANYGRVVALAFSKDGATLHCTLDKYEEVGGK